MKKELSIEEAKKKAKRRGLQLVRIKKTGEIRLMKKPNPRLETIGWDEFETILKKRRLAVYESVGG